MTAAEHLRQLLIDQGVVRDPRDPAPAGTPVDQVELPPCWVDLQEGTPAPGEAGPEGSSVEAGRDVVVEVVSATGLATQPLQAFLRVEGITVRYRSRFQWQAQLVDKQIRAEIDDHYQLDMAGLLVQQVRMWTPWQRTGADRQAFDSQTDYLLDVFEDAYQPDQG